MKNGLFNYKHIIDYYYCSISNNIIKMKDKSDITLDTDVANSVLLFTF